MMKNVRGALLRRLSAPKLALNDLRNARNLLRAAWSLRRRRGKRGNAHGLPAPLLVSLTSYPPRYGTLHLTLQGLMQQSVAPDGILLWIAFNDLERLPDRVTRLVKRGLIIKACDDVRAYKKLVFALEEFPDAYIVTADDDVFYKSNWLAQLVAGVIPGSRTVVCHRAARVEYTAERRLRSYSTWNDNVLDERSRTDSTDLMPIGVAGVLYPPGSLSGETTDQELFTRLAPMNDDLWFYWMARRISTCHKKVGPNFASVSWPRSQRVSLWSSNETSNDAQMAALCDAFGLPGTPSLDN